jgi:HK97 family phage major capsid protein
MDAIEKLRALLRQLNDQLAALEKKYEGKDSADWEEADVAAYETALASAEETEKELDRKQRRANIAERAAQTAGRQTVAPQPRDPSMAGARERGGFDNMAQFARDVMAACRPGGQPSERLVAMPAIMGAPTNFHRETGSSDGYMVPPAFSERIFELVFANAADNILASVDGEPSASNSVGYLADETTPWGATGIQANWRAEGAQMSASRLVTKQRQMQLHELYAFVLATEELLSDAPRLSSRLTVKAAQAIQWKANAAIWRGTGAGQPLGFLNGGSLVTVAKESGQAADTVNATNLAKMYSRLLMTPGGTPTWYANSDTLPQLIGLTVGNQPAWIPNNSGLQGAPNGSLLGLPLVFTEHADTVGDLGDVVLGDPKGYYAAYREQGLQFAESIHLYFDYNVQAFRWTFRIGGQPHLEAAITPPNSSSTKSHFVALAARA